MSDIPETRYAKSGDCHIAYQIVGKGPPPLTLIAPQPWSSSERTRGSRGHPTTHTERNPTSGAPCSRGWNKGGARGCY